MVHASDVAAYMAHVAAHLTYDAAVHLAEVLIEVAFLAHPFGQVAYDALQVLDAIV